MDPSFAESAPSEDAFGSALTPTSSHDVQNLNFLDQWERALEECKMIIDPAAYKEVMEFGSPEKLVDDLRVKEQLAGANWPSGLIPEVTPFLEMLKFSSNFFMTVMRPNNITTSFVWGFLHLALVMSTQSKSRWQQMSHTLQRTRELLQRLQVSVGKWENEFNEELKQAILDVFKALILFWAGASRYMREHKPGSKLSMGNVASYLDKSFEETFKRMDSAVRNLYELAAIKAIGRGEHRSFSQDQNMASMLGSRLNLDQNSPFTEAQLYQLPYDNTKSFVGRSDAVKKISAALDPTNGNKQQYFTIHGLGGVGKSSLALYYANKSVGKYQAIFWIRAETEASLLQSFTEIAMNLDIPDASRTGAHLENRDLVISWFIKCNMTWLIVLDNVEDLKLVNPFIPASSGSILLTTRQSRVAKLAPGDPSARLSLQPFTSKEDWGFFLKLMQEFPDSEWQDTEAVDKEEKEAAHKLLELLGGLPLGIKQVTALINLNYSTVADFLALYIEEFGDLRKIYGDEDGEMSGDHRYQYGLSTVWKISFDSLSSKTDRNPYYLLGMLSIISPDLIPWALFDNRALKNVAHFKPDTKTFGNARSELVKASLIDINQKERTISIHRLVQTSFINYLDSDTLRTIFAMTSTLLNARFPGQKRGRPLKDVWEECEKYCLHVIKLAEWYSSLREFAQIEADSEFIELMSKCSWYLHEIGKGNDCLKLAELGMTACSDKKSRVYGDLLNTAGCQYFEQNKLILTRQNLDQCLLIRANIFAPEDEDLLGTLNNIANLLVAEERYSDALPLYNRVKTAKESLGPNAAVLVALCCNGLARAHMGIGNWDEAKENLDSSYAIMKEGRNHYIPGVLREYGNLARKQQKLPEALKYYEDCRDLLAEQAPNSQGNIAIYHKLGKIKCDMGEKASAKIDFRTAIDIAKRSKRMDAEGHIARSTYALSQLMKEDHKSSEIEEIAELELLARSLREMLEPHMGMTKIGEDDEVVYERLVCSFFR